ncbi:hypothetical protein Hanom_Chr02g00111121 [Helianthus anomalus]
MSTRVVLRFMCVTLMENESKCTLWTLSQSYGCGAMAMLRVIPSDSMLAQRLFSNARCSMWVDSKSQFRRDPLGVYEALLWRSIFEKKNYQNIYTTMGWDRIKQDMSIKDDYFIVFDMIFESKFDMTVVYFTRSFGLSSRKMCLQEGGMDAIKLEGGAPSRISSTVQVRLFDPSLTSV